MVLPQVAVLRARAFCGTVTTPHGEGSVTRVSTNFDPCVAVQKVFRVGRHLLRPSTIACYGPGLPVSGVKWAMSRAQSWLVAGADAPFALVNGQLRLTGSVKDRSRSMTPDLPMPQLTTR